MNGHLKFVSDEDPMLVADPRPPGARGRRAVFLDRDGVLNELVADPLTGVCESPLSLDEVSLRPGAALAAARLAQSGFALVCVTNQPAAAKGRTSVEQLLTVHQRVLELLAEEGVRLDASHLCLHHEAGVVTGLAGVCRCRKPAPGMLLAAATELNLDLRHSWMVGDTNADIAAGRAAGCRTALITNPASIHKRLQVNWADITVRTLPAATHAILARESETSAVD